MLGRMVAIVTLCQDLAAADCKSNQCTAVVAIQHLQQQILSSQQYTVEYIPAALVCDTVVQRLRRVWIPSCVVSYQCL